METGRRSNVQCNVGGLGKVRVNSVCKVKLTDRLDHRWYNRDSKEPQSPLYVSNAMFVSIIVVLATLGGIGEATRAKKWSNNILAQRDIAHAEASRELRRAREAASAAGDHKDRIDAFLRHKDSTTYAEEAYRRLLPRQEACSSAEVESSER